MPDVETMGVVGTIAPARQYCLLSRLYRHRADNLNMSSTWLWPRNDLIANVGVLVAAGAACLLASDGRTSSSATSIAALFLGFAFSVLRDATRALCLMRYTGQVSYGRPCWPPPRIGEWPLSIARLAATVGSRR
jgi:Co/Zn/Cd efflux system component